MLTQAANEVFISEMKKYFVVRSTPQRHLDAVYRNHQVQLLTAKLKRSAKSGRTADGRGGGSGGGGSGEKERVKEEEGKTEEVERLPTCFEKKQRITSDI